MARIARARLRIRDVGDDDELFALYEHRIPVVLGPGGRVLAEGHVRFWPLLWAVARCRVRAAIGGGP